MSTPNTSTTSSDAPAKPSSNDVCYANRELLGAITVDHIKAHTDACASQRPPGASPCDCDARQIRQAVATIVAGRS